MSTLNKVMLIGNLGADPDVRYTSSGDAVATIKIATTETWKDKNGEKKEETEWHKITLFRRLGEIAAEYLKKGSKVYIEGRIKTDKWKDKEGIDRYSTGVIADSMKMLSTKQSGASSAPNERNSAPPNPSFSEMENDIPF